MKRRWRRVLFTVTGILLGLILVALGGIVWLQRSGHLTRLAQDLVHRLSGHEVTIEAITFPAWNVLALTGVRFQQQLPGWHVAIVCPRLEAKYGLRGLLEQRIGSLHLVQPVVHLRWRDVPPPTPETVAPATGAPVAVDLPLARLDITQGTLHIQRHQTTHTLQQIEAMAQQQSNKKVRMTLRATLGEDAATVQVEGHASLDLRQPTGTWKLTTEVPSLPQLTRMLSAWMPPTLAMTQGSFRTQAQLSLNGQTLQGSLRTTLTQGQGHIAGITGQALALASDMTFESNPSQGTLRAQGELQLQAARIDRGADVSATQLSLNTPVQVQYTPAAWSASIDLKLQTQLLIPPGAIRAPALSGGGPLQLQSNANGWSVQGDLHMAVPQVTVGSDPSQPGLRLDQLQGRMPIRLTATMVETRDARLQAKAAYGRRADTSLVQTALALQATSRLDLAQQRLSLQHCRITLPALGHGSATGTWQLSTQSVRDVHVTWQPTSAAVLWQQVADRLPASYQNWQVTGQTQFDLQAPLFSWAAAAPAAPVSLVWQLRDVAFSSPAGEYAGEHLNGTLQVTATLATATRPYTMQGTLTLQPFALLIGRLFAALEQSHTTSVVTFNGSYGAPTQHAEFHVAGQFGHLGSVDMQGVIRDLLGSPQYDLSGTLERLHIEHLGKTFWPADGMSSPPFLRGMLQAQLHLRGHGDAAHWQGRLNVSDLRFHTDTVVVDNLSVQLPLAGQYPLPQTIPDATTLPATAFGRLHLSQARLGGVALSKMQTRLALRSDTILFPDDITLSLLGGQVRLQEVVAARLLQPQRHLQLRLQAQALDLQKLPETTTTLPLSGSLNADWRRVILRGGQLQTEGAATVDIASGRVRIADLQGYDLFSRIPTLQSTIATEQPLSLLQLTRLYPIGDIGGTLHFRLADVTLTAGEPSAFHLRFEVQEKGGEHREITLRALNNLLFTTGSAKVETGFTYRLPYRQFGAEVTLRHDTLRLRGLYHDKTGREYFMRAPPLGGGVSIVNRTPKNGVPFRDFLRRLKSTVLEGPDVRINP
jgi:hypothetical protein